MKRAATCLLSLSLLGSCDQSLPSVSLELSKNCNDVEVVTLIGRVGDASTQILDIAADSAVSDTAWVLVRRLGVEGMDEIVVQRVSAGGVEDERVIEIDPIVSPALSLEPAPESGRVWVVRDEPGAFSVWRVDPDDPLQEVLGSENLATFPADGPLCDPCDSELWPRDLIFMDGAPALASLPPFSVDAGLVVWVGVLDTEGFEIRMDNEHRLNFEPPCEATTPEGEAFCEEQRENLFYPEVTVLGKQADPRRSQTVFFGHRTRSQTFDGESFPLESADVFMVALFFDGDGVPAGVLRSYSGFYAPDGPLDSNVAPLPSASPPFGVAVDRFAAYGLFSNSGVVPRLVQLPDIDPDFVELSGRVPLTTDTHLLQLDRDLAMGRLVSGQWELTKLFPDQPSRSEVTVYSTDDSIREVVSGGVGTFMLRKDDSPPEVVRLRCPVDHAETETETETET